MYNGIIISIAHKHILRETFLTLPEENKQSLKYYSNQLTTLMRNTEIHYYEHQFHLIKHDLCKSWKTTKEIIGRKKLYNKLYLFRIHDKGTLASVQFLKSKSNTFNACSVDIGPVLACKIKSVINTCGLYYL